MGQRGQDGLGAGEQGSREGTCHHRVGCGKLALWHMHGDPASCDTGSRTARPPAGPEHHTRAALHASLATAFVDRLTVDRWPLQVNVLVPRNGPKLKPEQTLVLVGSSPALGRWDPAQGLPLERVSDDHPMWATQAELPLGDGLQAKVRTSQRTPTLLPWGQGTHGVRMLP